MANRLRLRAPLAVALALALLAGCGGGSEVRPDTDQLSEPAEEFEADPAFAETIAVVDLRREQAEEPVRLDFADDASLEGLNWSGWGNPTARGRGVLRLLTCEPNCAEGETETHPASVVLSGPVECEGQRYYSQAEVIPREELELGAPASFIEAPC